MIYNFEPLHSIIEIVHRKVWLKKPHQPIHLPNKTHNITTKNPNTFKATQKASKQYKPTIMSNKIKIDNTNKVTRQTDKQTGRQADIQT